MNYIQDKAKFDIALKAASQGATAVTSKYFNMAKAALILFVYTVADLANGEDNVLKLVQAKDAEGTDSKDVTGATVTINANADATEATVQSSSPAAGDTITINGIVLTAATSETISDREFDQSGTDAEAATSIANIVNDDDYGIPGVTASTSTDTVTLTVDEPGEDTLSVETSDNTNLIVVATISGGIIELGEDYLEDGYGYVALVADNDSDAVCSAVAVRGSLRYSAPDQNVGGVKKGI